MKKSLVSNGCFWTQAGDQERSDWNETVMSVCVSDAGDDLQVSTTPRPRTWSMLASKHVMFSLLRWKVVGNEL